MPENSEPCCQNNATIAHGLTKRRQCFHIDANWLRLPYELWLTVLVDYGVSAADLVCLEYSNKWFSNGWGGTYLYIQCMHEFEIPATNRAKLVNKRMRILSYAGGSVTEEAARLIVKKYKRKFFGDLVNRIGGASWKEKLYGLEKIALRLPTTATGSYQNITLQHG